LEIGGWFVRVLGGCRDWRGVIGLTAELSAAAFAYLGLLQVDNTTVTYKPTGLRLALLNRDWLAGDPAKQADPAAFDQLVAQCEEVEVLATERTGRLGPADQRHAAGTPARAEP
jgi:SMODS and SLOG-associating 2TM effector domain 1